MIEISKEIGLDYGHTLHKHANAKCGGIHGHRARVIAVVHGAVRTDDTSQDGMVIDFGILKELMNEFIHDPVDHGFIIQANDPRLNEFDWWRNDRGQKLMVTQEPPTAEFLAKWAAAQLITRLPKELNLVSLTWFETPTSYAIWKE